MPLKNSLMFEEAQPSEVVSAYLPHVHVIWSSNKRILDAHFSETGDVHLQGAVLLVAEDAERKGRHNFRDCLRHCWNMKEIDSLWWDADASPTLSFLTSQRKLQDEKREV